MAEHAARYKRFQLALAEAGFASVAHDHRGHGRTTADGSALGRYALENGHRLVVDEIQAIHFECEDWLPNVPVITFGHSAGGLMALNFTISHPSASRALAIWNSNFSAGLLGRVGQVILSLERLFLGKRSASIMTPKLTFDDWNKKFAPNRTGFDWLSRDESEVDAYVADPKCGFPASVIMWQDIFQLVYRGANDRNLARLPKLMPIMILGGAHDPATSNGTASTALAERCEAIGMAHVQLEVLPETRHETLNEVNRDAATALFIEWAEAALRK